jgi:transcriptional regulator with XRE-family HTH domain
MRLDRRNVHASTGQHGNSINRLRNLIGELGWTQAELAEKVGVTPRTVSLWATGKTKEVPKVVIIHLELLCTLRRASGANR